MFIFDATAFIIFCVVLALVYGVLEVSDNQEFKTPQARLGIAVSIAIILTLIYSFFMSQGTETLLTDNYVDAGSRFNNVSGMDSLKTMADI